MQLHLDVVDEYDEEEGSIGDDAVSMLSDAAPQAGYIAYRPANNTPVSSINLSPTLEPPPILMSPTRIPTPPKLLPIVWPGVFPSRSGSSATPSRTPSSRVPSRVPSRKPSPLSRQIVNLQSQFYAPPPSQTLVKSPSQSASLRLFNFNVPAPNTQFDTRPHSEPVPWATSPHFHACSNGAHEGASLIDTSFADAPKKQYVRSPRHLQEPWQTGGLRRLPWRGLGALFFVLIRESNYNYQRHTIEPGLIPSQSNRNQHRPNLRRKQHITHVLDPRPTIHLPLCSRTLHDPAHSRGTNRGHRHYFLDEIARWMYHRNTTRQPRSTKPLHRTPTTPPLQSHPPRNRSPHLNPLPPPRPLSSTLPNTHLLPLRPNIHPLPNFRSPSHYPQPRTHDCHTSLIRWLLVPRAHR